MAETSKEDEIVRDLASVINKHSLENLSGTPDFILAAYLFACLTAWGETTKLRDKWWSFDPKIGGTIPAVDNGD